MLNKDANFWVWIKALLISFLLVGTSVLKGNDSRFPLYKQSARNGQVFIRLGNRSRYPVHCSIYTSDGHLYADFYVAANDYSRWYPEPYGYYTWQCG